MQKYITQFAQFLKKATASRRDDSGITAWRDWNIMLSVVGLLFAGIVAVHAYFFFTLDEAYQPKVVSPQKDNVLNENEINAVLQTYEQKEETYRRLKAEAQGLPDPSR